MLSEIQIDKLLKAKLSRTTQLMGLASDRFFRSLPVTDPMLTQILKDATVFGLTIFGPKNFLGSKPIFTYKLFDPFLLFSDLDAVKSKVEPSK